MSPSTLSQRLYDNLDLIISSIPPGDRLPSEPRLAQSLGVSRATLREAMRTFETQGRIRRKQGSGTYVTHPSHVLNSGLEILESIETVASRIGLPVQMEQCKIEIRPGSTDEIQALGQEDGANVLSIERVIVAESRPVAYLIDILPERIIHPTELGENFTGSVLDVLLKRGAPILGISRTEINADTANPEIARLLGIQRGDVLLRFTAFLYTNEGRLVDYSHSYFLPGYFRFHVVRRVGSFTS
jgi:GntR family transcriptional regulator